MNIIESIIAFITTPVHTLSSKFTVFLVCIILCLLIDNLTGFTLYYNLDRKIDELQKISAIINNPTNDSITKLYAVRLRGEVTNRKTVVEILSQSLADTRKKSFVNSNEQNNIFFWLSVCYITVFIFFRDSFRILIRKDRTPLFKLAEIIVSAFLWFLLMMFVIWVFRLIPQISPNTWVWNYFLNMVIMAAFVIFLSYTAPKKSN